jgi:hypothetical protein
MERLARFVASLLVLLSLLAPAAGLRAQQTRTFPAATKVGVLQVTQHPQALLDKKAVQLAPGARILNESNIFITPTALTNPTPVRYRLDSLGHVLEVWVLTQAELDKAKAEAASKENAAR